MEARSPSEKAREWKLQWYRHVRRREETYVWQTIPAIKAPGKRKSDRPKRRYERSRYLRRMQKTEQGGESLCEVLNHLKPKTESSLN